jgi:threonine/homoserine/homoserine lactone efflux protein
MTELLPLMTYCLVMSGTPGPNNVMLAATGANFGMRQALPAILGIQVGIFVQTLLACLGLGSLFLAYPVAQKILSVTGALYLLFLAWKLLGMSASEAKSVQPLSLSEAAIFQALNPKSWVKAVTIASVFIPVGLSVISSAVLATVISAMVGTPCSIMWALFGVSIRSLLKDPFKQRLFNTTMAVILLVLALLFLR